MKLTMDHLSGSSYLHQVLVDPFCEGLFLNSVPFICEKKTQKSFLTHKQHIMYQLREESASFKGEDGGPITTQPIPRLTADCQCFDFAKVFSPYLCLRGHISQESSF